MSTMSLCSGLSRSLFTLLKIPVKNNKLPLISNRLIQLRPQYRSFHASGVKRLSATGLTGLASLIFIRPIAKVVAMIFGRSMRKWWQSVPPGERFSRIGEWMRLHRTAVSIGTTCIAGSWVVFYVLHLEKVPIVGRYRFVPLTPYQYRKISDEEEEMIASSLKDNIIGYDSSEEAKLLYLTIGSVSNRILKSNAHLIPGVSERKWKIILVDDGQANAFAVPSGSVYVYTGLFNVVSNEHELAMVMAHELSHAILQHGLENLTRATLLDVFMTIVLASLWCIMPGDGSAVVASWFCHRVADLLFKLPFSRNLEREADSVGIDLLSRACFDPRQAAVVWRKMELLEEIFEDYDFVKADSKRELTSNAKRQAVATFATTLSPLTAKQDLVTFASDRQQTTGVTEQKQISTERDKPSAGTIDFFSTHPSSAERYSNMRDLIASGGTKAAAKEGRCDDVSLSKPLPNDYDSPRKLRSDILQVMGHLLVKRPVPELSSAAGEKNGGK